MGAIAYLETATTDVAWDAPANERRLKGGSPAPLRAAFAWVDESADLTARTSYRFIHHVVDADGHVGAADTRGCLDVITALNGGRSGATIPAADRQAVYAHVAAHLRDANMQPPALRAAVDIDDLAPAHERRYTNMAVEMRMTVNGEASRTITGYAAVFGRYSHNLGGFVERVAPTFFNKARGDGWPGVLCRFNHQDNFLMGTTEARTLRLLTDEMGLRYEVDAPKSREDVVELVERGDVRHSSFAFRAVQDEWTLTDQGYPLRTLHSGQFLDVAPCVRAAYPDTSAALRSLADFMNVDVEEIRHMSAGDELRNLWERGSRRTEGPRSTPKKIFGPAAAAQLDQRREDPWQ